MMKRILKSAMFWVIVGELAIALIMWLMGFRITYAPELDNNWDAISAIAVGLG